MKTVKFETFCNSFAYIILNALKGSKIVTKLWKLWKLKIIAKTYGLKFLPTDNHRQNIQKEWV